MKILVAGIWSATVALGVAYGVVVFSAPGPKSAVAPVKAANLQVEKTRVINVPMISAGVIRGFVVAKFAYTVDPVLAKQTSASPEVFILDEAFRAIYTDDHLDFLHLEKYNINALTQHLLEATNRRLGVNLVHDVLVQDFSYISKEENDR